MNGHQVKPEAVDVIFPHPIGYGFADELAHHRPFAGDLVTTATGVAHRSVFAKAVEVVGNEFLKVTILTAAGMVVHHVHHYPDAGFVQRHHHLLELTDTDFAVARVSRVTTLRDVVIQRIIAPVELRIVGAGFIHSEKVETW